MFSKLLELRNIILVRIKMKDTDCHQQTVTQRFQEHHHILTKIKVRQDDVWIVTFPKCGTTWTQELVWNIVNGVQAEFSTSMSRLDPRNC